MAGGNAAIEHTMSATSSSFVDYAHKPTPPSALETKYRGGITTHFPALLHSMLTRAEVDRYNHICGWKEHGRAFSVFDRDRFVNEVMPLYFRQTQFASFQRQLNLYGFQRASQKSPDYGSYYHMMFLRTRDDLCPAIQRSHEKDARDTKKEKEKEKKVEPDFSNFDPMPEITDRDIQRTICISGGGGRSNSSGGSGGSGGGGKGSPSSQSKREGEAELTLKGFAKESTVEDICASLFLGSATAPPSSAPRKDDLDLSWMEPRPFAPGSAPAVLLPKQEPAAVQSLLDDIFGKDDRKDIMPVEDPSASKSMKRSRRKDAAPHAMAPAPIQDTTLLSFLDDVDLDAPDAEISSRKRRPVNCGTSNVLSFSMDEENFAIVGLSRSSSKRGVKEMAGFNLDDLGLSAVSSAGIRKPSSLETPGLSAVSSAGIRKPSSLETPGMDSLGFDDDFGLGDISGSTSQKSSRTKLSPVMNALDLSSTPSSPAAQTVQLPFNCKEFEKLVDQPLLVTRARAPYHICHASNGFENRWGYKNSELADKPLDRILSPKTNFGLLNTSVSEAVRSMCAQDVSLYQLSRRGSERLSRTTLGPFFMNETATDVEYVVWKIS